MVSMPRAKTPRPVRGRRRLSTQPPASVQSLRAARLVSANVVALIGQFVIAMPKGYLGPSDQLTVWGMYFLAVSAALGGLAFLLLERRSIFGSPLALANLSFNAAVMTPALAADPLPAMTVIVWQVTALALHLFGRRPYQGYLTRIRGDDPEGEGFRHWLGRHGAAARHVSLTAVGVTVAIVGYELSHHVVAWIICLVPNAVAAGYAAHLVLPRHRRRPLLAVILGLPLGVAVATVPVLPVAATFLVIFQLTFIGVLVRETPVAFDLYRTFSTQPAVFVILSFLVAIAVGTLLLTFPAAEAPAQTVGFSDALFTAVSAVCITGLVVVDTGSAFSGFGQAVILTLIQAGGLGIMVLSTFGTLALGGSLGLGGERALGELLNLPGRKSLYRLVGFIVVSTLLVEALGAIYLSWAFWRAGEPVDSALWNGVFHAVSAFCNAGFALQSDSLSMFADSPLTLFVVSVLIILGGLGFTVLATLWTRLTHERREPLSLHVKLVLSVSAVLLGASFLVILATEWSGALAGLSPTDKLMAAFFHSATLRTAGFHAIDLGLFREATLALMMGFMFIGAAPGGTAGGIKVTTVGVLIAALPAFRYGEGQARIFGRAVPMRDLFRSGAVAIISLMFLGVLVFALLLTQTGSFGSLLFEAVSASGTVGLSLGSTSHLDLLGRVLIMTAMLIGRIGPLTFALAFGAGRARRAVYPEESLMIG